MAQLAAQMAGAPPGARPAFGKQIAAYQKLASEQSEKKQKQQADADQAGKDYDRLNYRDDQFDLSDALLATAISLPASRL